VVDASIKICASTRARSDQVESIHIVVPAKAGTQDQVTGRCPWTPPFAGVTKEMFYLIGFSSSAFTGVMAGVFQRDRKLL